MGKILSEITSFVKTFACFLVACCVVPLCGLSFISVHYSSELFNYILRVKYPKLEISNSNKIRTFIDTPRNAGIFHFLLQLPGPCDFPRIKQFYVDHLTDLRNKNGSLRFPKFKQQLITCWGRYAWVKDLSLFNIDNHVILSNTNYRGRPVNESNIQDFVSELITKYIPTDLPQWQVIVIPTASTPGLEFKTDDRYYILIKVHHLLLAEQAGLHVSELLMLKSSNKLSIDVHGDYQDKPKLSYFIRKPIHIRNLCQQIWLAIINRWNAFTYDFDSLESPDSDKKLEINSMEEFCSVFLITTVTVVIDFWRAYYKIKSTFRQRYNLFLTILRREVAKRNLSYQVLINSIQASLHPVNILKNIIRLFIYIFIKNILLLPYNVYLEISACKDILFTGSTKVASTYSGIISIYLPLIIYAQIEFVKICYEIYKAPSNIFKTLLKLPTKEINILQVKTYSGRKVVAFTKQIHWPDIRNRLELSGINEYDFTLACLAGALREYFSTFKDHPIPSVLNTTCRTISKGYFTEKGGRLDHVGGVVLLQLPLVRPSYGSIRDIQKIIKQTRDTQSVIYLASLGQTNFDMLTAIFPSVLTRIFINYFSFNFPVTLTEIYGNSSEFETIWGQTVEDLMLFRPPQSKTSLSLNIHRFGERTRLAIIADTQLAPDHTKISTAFETLMETVKL